MGKVVDFLRVRFKNMESYGVNPLLTVRIGMEFPTVDPKTCWRVVKSGNGHVVWESPDGREHLIHGNK